MVGATYPCRGRGAYRRDVGGGTHGREDGVGQLVVPVVGASSHLLVEKEDGGKVGCHGVGRDGPGGDDDHAGGGDQW